MQENAKRPKNTQPWHAAASSVLAATEDQGFRIIGVTGDRMGVGVSLVSRALAQAYAHQGITAILVDASRVDLTDETLADLSASFDLMDARTEVIDGVTVVDLAENAGSLPRGRQAMKELFARTAQRDIAIVVDLPAVRGRSEYEARALGVIGAACECVLLVCLSGDITRADLRECISNCKINRVPISGIIINDWKEPAAWIASYW